MIVFECGTRRISSRLISVPDVVDRLEHSTPAVLDGFAYGACNLCRPKVEALANFRRQVFGHDFLSVELTARPETTLAPVA